MQKHTRKEILVAALEGREQEVATYQINIDNYSIAIDHISKMPVDEQVELSAFVEQLRNLLASERLEQKKAKVMLGVLKQQLE